MHMERDGYDTQPKSGWNQTRVTVTIWLSGNGQLSFTRGGVIQKWRGEKGVGLWQSAD